MSNKFNFLKSPYLILVVVLAVVAIFIAIIVILIQQSHSKRRELEKKIHTQEHTLGSEASKHSTNASQLTSLKKSIEDNNNITAKHNTEVRGAITECMKLYAINKEFVKKMLKFIGIEENLETPDDIKSALCNFLNGSNNSHDAYTFSNLCAFLNDRIDTIVQDTNISPLGTMMGFFLNKEDSTDKTLYFNQDYLNHEELMCIIQPLLELKKMTSMMGNIVQSKLPDTISQAVRVLVTKEGTEDIDKSLYEKHHSSDEQRKNMTKEQQKHCYLDGLITVIQALEIEHEQNKDRMFAVPEKPKTGTEQERSSESEKPKTKKEGTKKTPEDSPPPPQTDHSSSPDKPDSLPKTKKEPDQDSPPTALKKSGKDALTTDVAEEQATTSKLP